MDELNRQTVQEYKIAKKLPCCIILDDIRSMSNVGSIFRTADGFSVSKIFLCGISPIPPHREIEKTALGATDSVDWVYEENIVELILRLKTEGWKIISLEQADESMYLEDFKFGINEKVAFILGNEVFGVKDEVIDLSDAVVEIPQFGTKHSLNVSVANGILLWDYYSKIKGKVLVNPS